MTRFAENTTVPVERSRAEIEKILQRYGADQFLSGYEAAAAFIVFRAKSRQVRFVLTLPSVDDKRYLWTPHRRNTRSPAQRRVAWEQDCRSRWRALCLCIKAKLEAVEAGISEFEQEFFANIVDPATGRTVYESIAPQLQLSYESHQPQRLLLGGPA